MWVFENQALALLFCPWTHRSDRLTELDSSQLSSGACALPWPPAQRRNQSCVEINRKERASCRVGPQLEGQTKMCWRRHRPTSHYVRGLHKSHSRLEMTKWLRNCWLSPGTVAPTTSEQEELVMSAVGDPRQSKSQYQYFIWRQPGLFDFNTAWFVVSLVSWLVKRKY